MVRSVNNGSSGSINDPARSSQESGNNSDEKLINSEQAEDKPWSFRRLKKLGQSFKKLLPSGGQSDFQAHEGSTKIGGSTTGKQLVNVSEKTRSFVKKTDDERLTDRRKLNQPFLTEPPETIVESKMESESVMSDLMTSDSEGLENFTDESDFRVRAYSFRMDDKQGEGKSGQVIKVRDKATNQFYAAKFMSDKDASMVREINTMAHLSQAGSPRLVQLVGTVQKDGKDFVVMELGGESLKSRLERNDGLVEGSKPKIISQLIEGASVIADYGYLHRDLKPDNLLIDEEGNLKICDFGVSQPIAEHEIMAVPITYMPPDYMDGCRYFEKVDPWSIGCSISKLVTGQDLIPLFVQWASYPPEEKLPQIVSALKLQSGHSADYMKEAFDEIIGLDADGEIEPEQLEKRLLHWRNNVIVHLVDRAAAEIGQELGTDAEDLFRGLMDMDPRKRLTVGAANNHRFVQAVREKEAQIHSVGIQHHVSEQGDLDGYLEPVSHLVSTEGYLEPISNEHLSFEETLSVSPESHSENPVEMLPVVSESDSLSIGSSRLSLLVSDEGYETQRVDGSDSDSVFSLNSGALNDGQVQEVVGAAGHADTFIMVGDGYIGKLTSKNEVDVYRRRKELNLDSIIPQAKNPNDLSASHRAKLAPLEARSAQSDQMGVIVPEMLGTDIPVSQKIEMDIKIGFRTASKAQLKKDDHRSPTRKAARHKLMDTFYGSKSRGYRVEGLKVRGNKPQANRFLLTHESKKYIKSVMNNAGTKNRDIILSQLRAIRANLVIAPVTFVANSALFLIDTENPENTVVKLIDLAHPIYRGDTDYKVIKQESIDAINRLIDFIMVQ